MTEAELNVAKELTIAAMKEINFKKSVPSASEEYFAKTNEFNTQQVANLFKTICDEIASVREK